MVSYETENARDVATILAALRKLQREGYDHMDTMIATDNGEHTLMSLDEIDGLCQRINA